MTLWKQNNIKKQQRKKMTRKVFKVRDEVSALLAADKIKKVKETASALLVKHPGDITGSERGKQLETEDFIKDFGRSSQVQRISSRLLKDAFEKTPSIDDLDFDCPDTCLHDCVIYIGKQKLFVNVKISDVRKKPSKNDIAAVEKLFYWYTRVPSYDLIYVNPRNDKIQALYEHQPIYRTRKAFLNLLKKSSQSIPLEDENE